MPPRKPAPAPMPAPVLGAGVTATETLDGVSYTLGAPTFGEAGAMLAASMAEPAVSQAMLTDAMRQALLADEGKAPLAELLDQAEAAEDDLTALLATAPPSYDTEGMRVWRAEVREEEQEKRKALLRARRAAEAAEHAAWDAPAVRDLREQAQRTVLAAAARNVATCLRDIKGGARDWAGTAVPDDVLAAIPMRHVLALAPVAQGLLRPGPDARKN